MVSILSFTLNLSYPLHRRFIYWSSCTPPTKPPTPWIIPSIIPPPPSLPPVALVNNPIPHSQPDPCWLVSWLAGWLRIPKEYPISKTFPPLGGPNIIRQILTTIYFLCDNPAAVELYIWTKQKPSVAAVLCRHIAQNTNCKIVSFHFKWKQMHHITSQCIERQTQCIAMQPTVDCNSKDRQCSAVQQCNQLFKMQFSWSAVHCCAGGSTPRVLRHLPLISVESLVRDWFLMPAHARLPASPPTNKLGPKKRFSLPSFCCMTRNVDWRAILIICF